MGQENFSDILLELRGLEKDAKKLLVIDDVNEIKHNQNRINQILALKMFGYKILFTSREEMENIEILPLDVLSLSDAKKLFNSIFKIEDESLLDEMVSYLDGHAFFIEMTAKSLKINTQRTPEKIVNMFRNGEFSKIKANKEETFNDYLNEKFSLDGLDEEDILLLKKLSILPSIEMDFKLLTKIFGRNSEDDIEDFQDLLNFLVQKGWLSSNGNSYKLHQIIKEFIWTKHQPKLQEIDNIVTFFAKLIENNTDIQSATLLTGYLVYFKSINSVLNRLKQFNEKITTFWGNLGTVYYYNGLYDEALPLFVKVVKVTKKVLGEEHPSTATSYNNLAGLYESMGAYEKAEPLYDKALSIREKVLGEEHPDTATSYNNLAGLYWSMGVYEKAEPLYEKALSIRKKVLGKEHHSMSR